MEAYISRGRFNDIWLANDHAIRLRWGQIPSHDFMVYKMKPSVRDKVLGTGRFGLVVSLFDVY